MRKIRCRAQPTRRPTVAQAILIGLALLFPAVQAAEPPRLSDKTAVESAERALIDQCSNAKRSKQPSTGENQDIVAAQLLLTIERTDAPALRKNYWTPTGAIWVVLQTLQNSEKSEHALRPRANLNDLPDYSVRLNGVPFLQRHPMFFGQLIAQLVKNGGRPGSAMITRLVPFLNARLTSSFKGFTRLSQKQMSLPTMT